ncbi:MAG: hypothetical protein ABSA53_05015 [Streptosporangiaceae bacterium]|jgi:hypothetical protein
MEEAPKAKPWWPDTTLECPVSRSEQEWIEASMSWCGREFGQDVLRRDIVRPTDFLRPPPGTAAPEPIAALVSRVCALMQVSLAEIKVNLFDASAARNKAGTRGSGRKYAVGHFRMLDGQPVIDLDQSESADRAHLTAIIAHELGHVRLHGEGRITADRPDSERLTDLLTVYFGLGIFTANAALRYTRDNRNWSVLPVGYLDERTLNASRNDGYKRLGYLSEQEFGYALGCYCWLRGETVPGWATHLNPGLQGYLTRSLAYLAKAGQGNDLPTQRLLGRVVRCGNAAIRVVSIPAHQVSPLGLVLPDVGRGL